MVKADGVAGATALAVGVAMGVTTAIKPVAGRVAVAVEGAVVGTDAPLKSQVPLDATVVAATPSLVEDTSSGLCGGSVGLYESASSECGMGPASCGPAV